MINNVHIAGGGDNVIALEETWDRHQSQERERYNIRHYPDTVTASSIKCSLLMSMTLTYDEQLVRNILDRLLLILIITHLGTELGRPTNRYVCMVLRKMIRKKYC